MLNRVTCLKKAIINNNKPIYRYGTKIKSLHTLTITTTKQPFKKIHNNKLPLTYIYPPFFTGTTQQYHSFSSSSSSSSIDTTCTTSIEENKEEYYTLAFYKFYDFPTDSLGDIRIKLLTNLNDIGVIGRIYISTEGINAQLSCPSSSLHLFKHYYQNTIVPLLGNENVMDLNFGTEGTKQGAAFRALHVRIRKQLVADGLNPDTYDLTNRPSHLSPEEWHQKLSNYKKTHGKDPVLIDMRNHYESNIGYFDGAIRPDANTFRDSITAMNDICKDLPRDQEVFMYCTGGIRCTKAGAILQSQSGFKTVHLVDGGITAYGRWIREQQEKDEMEGKKEEEKTKSIYRGKNFTFDARMGESITDEITGTKCHICGTPCNRYQNCAHAQCNLLLLCCPNCASQFLNTCGRFHCYDTLHDFIHHQKNEGEKIKPQHSSSLKHPDQFQYYDAGGPLMVNGVRAYEKKGKSLDEHKKLDRIVIGTNKACEHEYHRRIRAIDVLGEPGNVLKEWAKAGRQLPPSTISSSSQ
ncbi:unnamed protein product [Cunninghamella blakesleeana]